MTTVVRMLRSAEHDIQNEMAWYRDQQIGLELEFLAEVDKVLKRIAQRPTKYAKRLKEYRAVLVRRFPFTVYYRLVGSEIRVAAVLHHRPGQTARNRRLTAGSAGKR